MKFKVVRKSFFSLVILLTALFLSSCASVHHPYSEEGAGEVSITERSYQELVNMLQHDLAELGKDIDVNEARLVAETAIFYPIYLAEEYRLISPPIFHNLLVNLGFKERGLCIHWTEDLMKRLRSLDLKSFELHWAIANHKSFLWRDHSSVVITARGQAFEEGIVLDPWRHSGQLYWIPVKEDKYPWLPESLVLK